MSLFYHVLYGVASRVGKKLQKVVDKVGYTCIHVRMLGQRATNKKQFAAAFTKDELAAIDAAAARLGIIRTEFLRRAAMRQVQLETHKPVEK